jgi:hypothetical protein
MAFHDNVTLSRNVRAETDAESTAVHASELLFSPNGDFLALQRYTHPLKRLIVSYIDDINEADILQANRVWKIVGPRETFRIRDWSEWNSTTDAYGPLDLGELETDRIAGDDQPCINSVTGGVLGDASTVLFYTARQHTEGTMTATWRERGIIASSLLVEVNGVPQVGGGTDYTLGTLGRITFTSAPGNGLTVTCGYLNDTIVRYAQDDEGKIGLPFASAREMSGLTFMETRPRDT